MKTYSAMESPEGRIVVNIKSATAQREAVKDGVNLATVRRILMDANDNRRDLFYLAKKDRPLSPEEVSRLPDFLMWNWLPILSGRARELFLKWGAVDEDFVPCSFEYVSINFFAHLPSSTFDAVDITNSIFRMVIPMVPPLPHGVKCLVLKDTGEDLPHCFRSTIPGHAQVFSELFVSSEFENAWYHADMVGAHFRKL